MRFLKKCIKKLYHLIWFLSVFFVILLPVKAAGRVTIDGANFTQAGFADFADNTNGYLTRIYSTFVDNGSYYRSNDAIFTNGADTYGANWVYYSDEPFVEGYTYAVTVLIGMANTYPKASSTKVCIAENLTNAIARYNNDFPCTYASVTYANGTTSFDANGVQMNYGVLSYIFTADFTSNAITGSYNSNGSNESNHTFGGYITKVLSDNKQLTQQQVTQAVQSSGLATAQSVTQVQQSITQVQEELSSIDDTINNDNVDGANSQVDDLLNNSNFNDSTGIQSIINAPLNFINSLSNTCTPINLTIPYIDEPVQIPCIKQELNNHIPLVVPVLSTAINGFIIYRILLDIVRIIKNARNPDDDRIEVLDL